MASEYRYSYVGLRASKSFSNFSLTDCVECAIIGANVTREQAGCLRPKVNQRSGMLREGGMPEENLFFWKESEWY